MMLRLTAAEMLGYRRTLAGLEPSDLEFTIERTDGIDIDSIVAVRLRRWYTEMLRTAPVELLPVEDVAEQAVTTLGPYARCSAVTLPDGCIRPQTIRLQGWLSQARVLSAEAFDEVLRNQDNPFTAASARYPVAVESGCRPGMVLAFPAGAAVESLTAVKDPGDTHYILDETLLARLPEDHLFIDL